MRTTPQADRPTPRARYWQSLIQEWQRGDLTQREFCQQRGVNTGTFNWWKRQLARRAAERSGNRSGHAPAGRLQSTFAPVRIQPEGANLRNDPIEIVLARERRIRLSGPVDRQQLADVLAVLEAPSC